MYKQLSNVTMLSLDTRTAFVIAGLLYTLLPIVTWLILAKQRTQGVNLWCFGGILVSATVVLIGMRGTIPVWVSFTLANLLGITGFLLRIQALRLILGIPWRLSSIVKVVLLFILTFETLRNLCPDGLFRVTFVLTVLTLLLLHIVYIAMRIANEQVIASQSAKWIARSYLLVVCIMLFRLAQLWTGASAPDSDSHGPTFVMLPIALIVAAVFSHIGYIGLALERALQRERDIVATHALMKEESARLNEQISLLDRQRSVGAMSASLALQINQPLIAILADAQVARSIVLTGRLDATQLLYFFDKVTRKVQRVREITEQIQAFIRPADADRVAVDLNKLAHDVDNLVAREASQYQVKFIFGASEQPMWVIGDSVQLSQVLLNLYRNAIDALKQVPHPREVYVSVDGVEKCIILTVSDSGLGLTEEALEKVGTLFYTTKVNGLGMGISISRSIIAQHGGTLSIGNAEQGGASFEIKLPASPDQRPVMS